MVEVTEPLDAAQTSRRYTYGTWRAQKGWAPREIVDAEGCYFSDAQGNRFLDFSSQLMCSNLGHGNKAVIEAICEQARRLPYIAPSFATEARARLSKSLLEVVPEGLEVFFYSTSGTEANEAAFKIARLYTGKHKIISRYSSYHGSTAGSISATGDPRRYPIEPSGKTPGVIFGPDAYCYRCPFGLQYSECGIACADYVEYMIEHESNVAAVIVEPVVGTNGVLVPPDEYLPRLREITRKHDVLLICDEVMSGWGRTGEWFAVDHWNVKPDIMTTAKGITGAYIPLAVTATTRKIAEYFEDHYFAHGHTYEAHPLTLAPGIAAIQEYKRLGLIERSREMGKYLGSRLKSLEKSHPSIGEVRGIGLFWAVELVRDAESKEPFNTREDKLAGKPLTVDRLASECMKNGVYLQSWISHLIVAPPLIVTKEEIDQGVNAINKALEIADHEIL
ncbi:MAG TPA: aspartate aminotransferase family protein [Candidatus Bathyarchaeia archaeon]|nr:aspartate aminotransferase family protein [Candidatus Bathyarchaeia archaeon]